MEILELKAIMMKINSPDGLKNIFKISQKKINDPEDSLIKITPKTKRKNLSINETSRSVRQY